VGYPSDKPMAIEFRAATINKPFAGRIAGPHASGITSACFLSDDGPGALSRRPLPSTQIFLDCGSSYQA